MLSTKLAPAIKNYYAALDSVEKFQAFNEGATRHAFQNLLSDWGRNYGRVVLAEQEIIGTRKSKVRPDGVLFDNYRLPCGFWEAKDLADNLDSEITKKIAAGYPLTNTLFENTRKAVLYQEGQPRLLVDLKKPEELRQLLERFVTYQPPQFQKFREGVVRFKQEIPNLANSLTLLIDDAKRTNRKFTAALDNFLQLCRRALNPETTLAQVEDMLKQHILTERIFRSIFQNPDFVRRNAVAVELEKMMDALTSRSFSRDVFLSKLDYFYKPIEDTASSNIDYVEKQTVLNTLYEQFFQAYSRRAADTNGIVYTPAPIVQWMVSSVEQALKREFGKQLSSEGLHIIDPCVGTGNFIMEILRRIPASRLQQKYSHELHAHEFLLLPYYIASQNIEHAYMERSGEYQPFEGIVFADTLDMLGGPQLEMFAPENTERINRENEIPIQVIIGNPPYNAGQENENDNNKNRKHRILDKSISNTYAKSSRATNKNALSDPYVKFFRWATERLEDRDGIICYVSNNSFIDQIAFDGMRKHLFQDFTRIYTLDLGGNVRKNPKLSGTKHNVFGIQVGVTITLLIRNREKHTNPELYYARLDEFWTNRQKLKYLSETLDYTQIEWQTLTPDSRNTWLTAGLNSNFDSFLPMGTKEGKAEKGLKAETIFKTYGRGVATCRDDWVYGFDEYELSRKTKILIETYNGEVDRWLRRGRDITSVDNFVLYDDKRIKWSETLKAKLESGKYAKFDQSSLRKSLYRPFCTQHLVFDRMLIERVYVFPAIFPTVAAEQENSCICLTGVASEKPFTSIITKYIANLALVGGGSSTQCFPFYVYSEDGTNRRENITDWALHTFQEQYVDTTISKWDIFYYVYGVLHSPQYRAAYAQNLKRDLPRIPFVSTLSAFQSYVQAGRKLAQLHQCYEEVEPYNLTWTENPNVPLNWCVDERGMRLSPDRTSLRYNDWLTLTGIPAKVFEYRLGNRSALEWVIDQYRVSTDIRSGLHHDPNDPDEPRTILDLMAKVIQVSLETVEIVERLPKLDAVIC